MGVSRVLQLAILGQALLDFLSTNPRESQGPEEFEGLVEHLSQYPTLRRRFMQADLTMERRRELYDEIEKAMGR